MTAKQTNKEKAFRFHEWSRKSYAVFQSLGRVIHISVILVSYTIISQHSQAQEISINQESTDADTLPEVEITTSEPGVVMGLSGVPVQNIQLTQSMVQDASELAQDLPGTDIRQRGIHGVQGDVSIRGGSPEQAGILLNGIPINDVQTGHHNLDIPIPAISLTQIQRYTPGTAQQSGINEYSGALNFQNLLSTNDKLRVWISGGQYKYLDASIAADFSTGKAKHHISTAWKSSDGYSENTDFKSFKSYLNSRIPLTNRIISNIQAGYLNKSFGAESFYTEKYPTQFEAVNSLFGNVNIQRKGVINISTNIYYRQHNDRFELFREDLYQRQNTFFVNGTDTAKYIPGVFDNWNYYKGHNFHKTVTTGYQFNARTATNFGGFHLGLNHKHESILSSVLGKTLTETIPVEDDSKDIYKYKAIRDQINLLGSFQSAEFHKVRIGISSVLHYTKEYGYKNYSGARLHYKYNENISSWLAINQTMRLPSFTDLYYSGPTNKGNEFLKPESAVNYELGTYFHNGIFSIQNQTFFQKGKDIIDWIKYTEEDLYTSMNHTTLNTMGTEFAVSINTSNSKHLSSWLNKVELNYTFINKTREEDNMISAYALDYVKQQLSIITKHKIGKSGFGFDIALRYQERNGTYTTSHKECEYSPWTIMDFSASYKHHSQLVFIECSNVFDKKVKDFGSIELPGRWFIMGLKLEFGL